MAEQDLQGYRHRTIRLRGYAYTRGGAYLLTICTRDRANLFGEALGATTHLNQVGLIAEGCWRALPDHFSNVQLDAFVVMPNHLHGIICLDEPTISAGATHASPLQRAGPARGSIGAIVGSFKAAVSRRVNTIPHGPAGSVWQRNYHDHVIRNERALEEIRRCIAENPRRLAGIHL